MMSAVTKTRVAFLLPLAATLLLALGGEEVRLLLRYERALLPFEQAWRWLSGHFVHLGVGHALLNAAGLALVYLLFAKRLSAQCWMLVLICAIAAIDAGFWFLDRQLAWYVGLSGVLHALFAAGAIREVSGARREGLLLLAGLTAKLGWEQWLGPLPMTAEAAGGPVVVNAHLYGALGGALACGLIWAEEARRRSFGARKRGSRT